ncbi:uncharacterized protein HD556DRAFT_1436078 [Suillus plorans]|uniref:Protein HRI1 n=1 Tax=Suillus plorans TaxID=116603 RepID=A0A9P7E433_9AGAM|nr:uncharacterized protein HD556DRAFT_1436078 [Suillus plorans]KAG1810339.1 hypothetical protein HD556DRAFT_1436078 [Suillus plorans]
MMNDCALEQPEPLLYGTPSITIRKNISRNGGQPFEDSDVLVLSSRSTTDTHSKDSTQLYLDLRLSKPLLPESTIKWGFAGLRGRDGSPDEGTMTSCDGEEVETGIGVNPETGEQEQHIVRIPHFLTRSKSESTGFIAILGDHALAMRQNHSPNDTEFQAVRMRISTSSSSEVLFKQNADALLPLLESALSGVDNWKGSPWQRGQEITLQESRWTVWDAGERIP